MRWQSTMLAPFIREPMRFDEPLPQVPVWRTPEQRANYIENVASLSDGAWDELRANDDSSLWRLTFGGDPDLHLEICRRRRERRQQQA